MTDPYETLGVPRDASQDDIKQAFRRLATAAHPDKGGDPVRMAEINRAYEALGDAEKRAEFDATGATDGADSLEREARDRLVSLFRAALDTEMDDPMSVCQTGLGNARSEIEKRITATTSAVMRLRKQRDRVRRKGEGANLFQSLVDEKIKQADAQLAQLERGRAVFARVGEMLEAYESTADDATHVDPIFQRVQLLRQQGLNQMHDWMQT
jgi:curved DNA-binding protein CbpA